MKNAMKTLSQYHGWGDEALFFMGMGAAALRGASQGASLTHVGLVTGVNGLRRRPNGLGFPP